MDDGGRREDIGRGIDRGQESLELHAGRAPRVDGQRARRHRVHAVRGRRPGQLHRSGLVQRVPDKARHGFVDDNRTVHQRHFSDTAQRHHEQTTVRRRVRQRPYEGDFTGRQRCRFRRGNGRAAGLDLHLVRGGQTGSAHDLRDPVADDHSPRTRVPRPRPQSRDRLPPAGRPRRSPVVRPTVHQRGLVRVLRVLDRVHRMVREARRPETVRSRSDRAAVRDHRQQPSDNRVHQAYSPERRRGRRFAFGTARRYTART